MNVRATVASVAGLIALVGGIYSIIPTLEINPMQASSFALATEQQAPSMGSASTKRRLQMIEEELSRVSQNVDRLKYRQTPGHAPAHPPDEDLEDLWSAVASLQSELSGLRLDIRVALNQLSRGYVDGAASDTATEPGEDGLPVMSNDEAESARIAETLAQEFLTEEVDNSWSAEMYDLINTEFTRGDYAQTSVSDIDCRSSQCRVSLLRYHSDGPDDTILYLAESLGEEFSEMTMTSQDLADGTVNTVIYMRQ